MSLTRKQPKFIESKLQINTSHNQRLFLTHLLMRHLILLLNSFHWACSLCLRRQKKSHSTFDEPSKNGNKSVIKDTKGSHENYLWQDIWKLHQYTNPPKELGMVSLAERRDILCLKFAKKSLKVENFGHFFPVSSKRHEMQTRYFDIYKINKGYSKRYMQFAIPSMQRILNRDNQKQVDPLKQV